MMQQLQKTVWQVLKKLNLESPHDPAIPKRNENIGSYKILYTNVNNGVSHNSQKVKITEMFD